MQGSRLNVNIRRVAVGTVLAATAALALPASATAAPVGGSSTTGCSRASGVYTYEKTGETSTYDTYDAYFDITVSDRCSGDGWAASLYLSYRKYSGGVWSWKSMQRVKTNGNYNTTLHNVQGVQINVCDYYPDRAPRGCQRVW